MKGALGDRSPGVVFSLTGLLLYKGCPGPEHMAKLKSGDPAHFGHKWLWRRCCTALTSVTRSLYCAALEPGAARGSGWGNRGIMLLTEYGPGLYFRPPASAQCGRERCLIIWQITCVGTCVDAFGAKTE
jgi:hypothetical protein